MAFENRAGARPARPRTVDAASFGSLGLALVVLLGLGLRLYDLTSYGIWFDESYHVALVKLPTVASMLDAVLSNPPSDPLYALLLRAWVWLFGSSDGAIRSLSVLLGAATCLAIFRLGMVLGSRSAGLLGALLFAVSPYAVEFGQEAALYSLAALLTTLALSEGYRFLSTGEGGPIYLLLGIAALYSHYVAALIIGLFALAGLFVGPKGTPIRRWLAINGMILVAWIPWLVATFVHWTTDPLPRASIVNYANRQEVLDALVQYTSGTASLMQHAQPLGMLGLLFGGFLLLTALPVPAAPGRYFRLLLLLALVIFLVPAFISSVTGWWLFVSHFMLFLLPAILLAFAWGALSLFTGARAWAKWVALGCLCLWIAVQAAGLALFYRYPPHGADGLRDLAAVLKAGSKGEPVFTTPPILSVSLAQYYSGPVYGLPSDFDLKQVYLPYNAATWNSDSLQRLASLAAGKPRFWLVYRPELDQAGAFLATLRRIDTQVEHRSYGYADLFEFASRGSK